MRYRIKAYTRCEPEDPGYLGTKEVHYQDLQVKRWWGWTTIDREEVPNHVRIEIGALGESNWRSKFSDRFVWGRDGVCKPKEAV